MPFLLRALLRAPVMRPLGDGSAASMLVRIRFQRHLDFTTMLSHLCVRHTCALDLAQGAQWRARCISLCPGALTVDSQER